MLFGYFCWNRVTIIIIAGIVWLPLKKVSAVSPSGSGIERISA